MTEGRETRSIEERREEVKAILQSVIDSKNRRGIKSKIDGCGIDFLEVKSILRHYYILHALKTDMDAAEDLLSELGTSLQDLLKDFPDYQLDLVDLFFTLAENGGIHHARLLRDRLQELNCPIKEEQLHSQRAESAVRIAILRALSKGSISNVKPLTDMFGVSADLKFDASYKLAAMNYLISTRRKNPQMFDRVFSKYQDIFDFDTSVLVALEQGVLTTSDL